MRFERRQIGRLQERDELGWERRRPRLLLTRDMPANLKAKQQARTPVLPVLSVSQTSPSDKLKFIGQFKNNGR